MDYALLNNHEDCVDILTQAGGLLIGDIRTMAAVSIQTIYRGYRYKHNAIVQIVSQSLCYCHHTGRGVS